ncbi:MAG: CAP domain-containing protein [Actinomycetota bacterium]
MAVFKKTAALLLAAIVFGALAPRTPHSAVFSLDDAVAASSSDNQCWNYKKKEHRFTRKMNAERDDSNKQKLRLDPEISKVARKHTREMINEATLHHTPSSTLARRVTNWSVLGENVGVGGSVSSLHDAFMNSPSHKENILYSTFKHVGVGTKRDAGGRLWVTVIFEASNNPGTTLSMPRC